MRRRTRLLVSRYPRIQFKVKAPTHQPYNLWFLFKGVAVKSYNHYAYPCHRIRNAYCHGNTASNAPSGE